MSTKHTPRPWTADSHAIQQAARGIVAHYEGEAWKGPTGEFERRTSEVANLIAAAPDLLKASKGALEWLENIRTLSHDVSGHLDDGQPAGYGLGTLRRAIAKAGTP